MGFLKCDHIKELITLTSDNIKRFSLLFLLFMIDDVIFVSEYFTSEFTRLVWVKNAFKRLHVWPDPDKD